MSPRGPARLAAVLGLTVLLTGSCSSPAPATLTALPIASPDDRLVELVQSALQADALLEIPDSLYTHEATVVTNGLARFAPPRFAGVGLGGTVAITSTRFEVRAGIAWAYVEYRWVAEAGMDVREGRATIVLVGEGGAWRIHHAHSSSPPNDGPRGA